jgi:hypothetical protein
MARNAVSAEFEGSTYTGISEETISSLEKIQRDSMEVIIIKML